jgi:DNA-binding NarL/FixJ family response regulator
MTIGVVIADDQALVRGGFRVLVESVDDMHVLGEAGDGAEAVELTRRLKPDVVLMDIRMPGVDGIDATRHIKSEQATSEIKVLVLTTFDLDEYVYAALLAGASGFLLKDTSPENLLEAIRVVAAGDALLAPSVTRRLIGEFTAQVKAADRAGRAASVTALGTLTEREHEVLVEVAHGLSNSEIAESLHMSPATAKTHVSRLLMKLSVRDRVQLVVLAYETGIVTA